MLALLSSAISFSRDLNSTEEDEMENEVQGAVEYIRSRCLFTPKVGLILGSGLGDYADHIEEPIIIRYKDIPGFPVSSVHGHASQFVIGACMGHKVIAMQGRFHFYEGFSQQQIALAVRVMRQLGIEKLVVTNAAGGINNSFNPGTLMVITDHINYSGSNPLIGKNSDEFGPRFPDMSNVYDKNLRTKLLVEAKHAGIELREGVYMMFSGPSYETPAEIRMARAVGADAVGMSTVPEAITAAHCGIKTIGISCITNLAAGILEKPLNHEEVIETAAQSKKAFNRVLDLLFEKVL